MKEARREISPGIYEIERPDGSKIITGPGWATHIHIGEDCFSIKIQKTGEKIQGIPDFNKLVDKYLPGWMKTGGEDA